MYAVVGRFHFRPMGQEEKSDLMQRMGQDLPGTARGCSGFQALDLVQLSADELMTVWLWDNESDWDAAQSSFAPLLQEYVVPNLVGPPDRAGGEVVMQVRP
jgi:hypothetical protein